jgi:membrane-associated phospholipid phosphatase
MSPFQIQFAIFITNIFSPTSLIMLSIASVVASFLYLSYKKVKYREIFSVNCPNNIKGVLMIFSGICVASFLSQILKMIFKIPRPTDMLVPETGYSFPSGHATIAFTVCFIAIFLTFKYFKDHNKPFRSYVHAALFISIAIMVSASRIILHVHRPIDIFGGIIVAAISTYITIKAYYAITKYVDKKIL